MEHISSLSPGERLWFEQGVLAGDTVLVPHEALSDTPAFLALPRLRRRFRCTAREAAGLGKLFLALDASPAVVTHYEAEAWRLGVGAVLEEIVRLVVQFALVEQVPASDALEDADRLADGVEAVSEDGALSARVWQPRGDRRQELEGFSDLARTGQKLPFCGSFRKPEVYNLLPKRGVNALFWRTRET